MTKRRPTPAGLILALAVMMTASFMVCAPGGGWAAPSAQQLSSMVEQLRANPGDDALRQKIIETARAMTPPPPIPEEARRFFARGRAAVDLAQDTGGFLKAADEFREALNVAPWSAEGYYNLGVVLEKAGNFGEAMADFKLYLLAAPGAKDAEAVRDKVYGLDYKASQQAQAVDEKTRMERLIASLDGAVFYQPATELRLPADHIRFAVRISAGRVSCGTYILPNNPQNWPSSFGAYPNVTSGVLDGLQAKDICPGGAGCPTGGTIVPTSTTITLSHDGASATRHDNCPGSSDVFLRRLQ